MHPDNASPILRSDVLVVGAGPAGLALAAALAELGLTVRVLEQQARSAIDRPQDDGREIALTHRARRVMQDLRIWDHLSDSDVAPLREARVLDGDRSDALCFGPRADAAPLGWLVPNHRIRAAALAAASASRFVDIQCDARVVGLSFDRDSGELALADGRRFRARLVVAADSRLSQTRRMAGSGASRRDFGRSVVVGRVTTTSSNDAIAWECFRYANTLALLPMNNDRVSVVVTAPGDQVPAWLALSDDAFAKRIELQTNGRFGAMHADGPRFVYPLVGVYAHRFSRARFALIGDAAVGMHPVTAHGWNFGIYGVEALARRIGQAHRAGTDIGDAELLRSFADEHRRTTWPIYRGTNAMASLFTDDRPIARLARQAVLTLAGRAPLVSGLIKGAIEAQLTGTAASSRALI